MNNLKIGLVGVGWFGRKHLRVWSEMEKAEVVAIADEKIEAICSGNLESTQADFHAADSDNIEFTGNQYKSLDQLLENEELDVVDIVTPPETHFELGMKCLNAGKHVIIEKPVTTDLQELETLVDLAKQKELQIFTGHVLRFDTRALYIKEQVENGKLGRLRYLSFKRNFQKTAHWIYGNIHPLYSALIHDIDLAMWFNRSNIRSVKGVEKSFLNRKYPDVISLVVEFENGVIGQFENIWHIAQSCPYGFENAITLYGEKGNILQKNVPVIENWNEQKVEYPEFFFWPTIDGNVDGALRNMLNHYAHCLIHDQPSAVLGKNDILNTMKAIAVIENSLSRHRVELAH